MLPLGLNNIKAPLHHNRQPIPSASATTPAPPPRRPSPTPRNHNINRLIAPRPLQALLTLAILLDPSRSTPTHPYTARPTRTLHPPDKTPPPLPLLAIRPLFHIPLRRLRLRPLTRRLRQARHPKSIQSLDRALPPPTRARTTQSAARTGAGGTVALRGTQAASPGRAESEAFLQFGEHGAQGGEAAGGDGEALLDGGPDGYVDGVEEEVFGVEGGEVGGAGCDC